ncbi:unnamed protein product [Durusdinium trenchii]|uniref:Uncharacterized protein n=1 Tax=Durusdinium trenchii TaxID=1381693 RepID=A0ABP0L1V9_9DINO
MAQAEQAFCAAEMTAPSAPPGTAVSSKTVWTDGQLRQALLTEVHKHCCWSGRAAWGMEIREMIACGVWYLKLTSFVETREVTKQSKAYKGQKLDGPQNGSAPSMWNIQVKQMKNFEESKKYYTVPHTDVVAKCGKCTGTGKLSCEPCNGQGWSWCKDCRGEKWMWCPQCDGRAFKDTKGKGKGRPASETIDHCDHCRSTGFVSCRLCEGWGWKDCKKCHHGTVSCKKCDGYGDVVNYQQLTVQHSNIVLERKLDESGSSPTMSELREAQGSSKFFKAKVLEKLS